MATTQMPHWSETLEDIMELLRDAKSRADHAADDVRRFSGAALALAGITGNKEVLEEIEGMQASYGGTRRTNARKTKRAGS
jgi:hypothetical protein